MRRVRFAATGALAVLAVSGTVYGGADGPLAERMVNETLSIEVPASGCDVPMMAARLAQSVRAPAGIEYVAGCSRERPLDQPERLSLSGMTIGRALDRLHAVDPRYEWTEFDGVLLVRPLDAWMDSSHYLRQTLPKLSIADRTLAGAIDAVQAAIGAPRVDLDESPAAGGGNRRVTMSLPSPTILDALNAVVRADGSALWEITYCEPAPEYQYATFWLKPFDGGGVKSHAVYQRDAQGLPYDPCAKGR